MGHTCMSCISSDRHRSTLSLNAILALIAWKLFYPNLTIRRLRVDGSTRQGSRATCRVRSPAAAAEVFRRLKGSEGPHRLELRERRLNLERGRRSSVECLFLVSEPYRGPSNKQGRLTTS